MGILADVPCPDGCFCDKFNALVDCSRRGISSLSSHLPDNTRILLCQKNTFQWISENNFNITNLRRLRKLSLADNLITGVLRGSFARLPQLVRLNMSGNFLLRIPHDIRLLKSLNELDLSRNAIKSIMSHTFHKDSKLEVLFLTSNQLTSVDSEAFSTLEHLQVLSLRNNSISNIGRGALSGTTALEELDISMNRLGLNDPDGDDVVPLNVSDWFTTPNSSSYLTSLYLNDNLLQDITWDAFNVLTSLHTLDLHSNLIGHLYADVFQEMTSLEVLVVNQNQLEALPLQLFKQSLKLRHIDLHDNLISDIPIGTFSTNRLLEVINMAGNQLIATAWLLHIPMTITELHLSNNLLDDIPHSAFKFLPNLQILDLDNNRLTGFPRLWNNTKLSRVQVAGNMISSIPQDTRFHLYQDLVFLSLARNSLDTLNEDVCMSLPPLQEFLVDENPFECDCRLLWMDYLYSDLLQGAEIPPNVEPWISNTYISMVCEHPTAYRGSMLADIAINRHNLGCSYFASINGVSGLVIGWLLVLGVVVCAYWRWKCKSAEKRMRAWKRPPPGRHKKPTVSDISRHGEPKVNGRVKNYDPSTVEYISQFDRESNNSLTNVGERDRSPACVCLLQPENMTGNSDILTETTV
ncbi:uncharacterized protein [Diadema antillarum]|uniref:uncharacterized protein n=1 Tax=Diadema antillarum TaxID=105358 RepID=UPI003A8861CF